MRWEELTSADFVKAVKEVKGVCLLAVGCLEKHADHLPLGTDFLNGFKLCDMAAEKEPAIVFPYYYFGQIHEARPFAGTVAIDPYLTLQILENVCDEISRNGCHKIILRNSHGGNKFMLGYFAQMMLAKRRDYSIYIPPRITPDRQKQWDAALETPVHGHACECETSWTLANYEHLVKMDRIKGKADPLGRQSHIPPGLVSNEWYTDFPEHYAGDARAASKAKGLKLQKLLVDSLAEYIKAVKEDTAVATLTKEFYDRVDRVGK
jgi:creatinine amidohydrolase